MHRIITRHVAASTGSGDWGLRSTASGVVFYTPLATQAEIDAWRFVDAETVPVALDTSTRPFGQVASTKFTSAPADAGVSGTLKIPFGQTFGPGQTFWFSIRQYQPPEWAYMTHPVSSAGQPQGMKQFILAGTSQSNNQAFSTVLENMYGEGTVNGYNWNSNGVSDWTSTVGSDIVFQPQIDNSGANVSPDSVYSSVNAGTDPDTGSAFSASQIGWSRYGGSFLSEADSAYARGLGHPLSGAMRYPVSQFATYTMRIVHAAYGSATSRLTLWVAQEGQAYVRLIDKTDVLFSSSSDPGFQAAWVLAYYTARTANSGLSFGTISNSALASCMVPRVVGLGTAAGPATIRYTASNKRLTLQEAGGSIGTARGLASWKRYVNVISGGSTGNYDTGKFLGLEITNFAGLPASDQAGTVTISTGRGTQTTNYAEMIVSTAAINATAYNSAGTKVGPTGGYAPSDGGDSSALGTAIRSLSDNTWGTFTCGTFNPDPLGSGDSVFSYAQRATYYNGKIYFFGGCHGSGGAQTMFLNVYDLDSNSWLYQVSWPNNNTLFEHGFYCGTVDRTTGDFIGHCVYGSSTPLKRWVLSSQTFGTNITTPPNGTVGSGIFYALEYHPALGALVFVNEWDIAYTTSSTGASWTERDNTYPAGKAVGSIAYNRKDTSVYIGGTDTSSNALQKINASGTLSTCASAPNGFGVWDATVNTTSMLLPSGNSANKLLQISRDSNIYEYDDAANSWSGSIGTVPTGLISGGGAANSGANCVFCAVDDDTRNIHGIVVFKLGGLWTVSSTAHIWKR